MLYIKDMEAPTDSSIDIIIDKLYYVINTIGLLELYIKTLNINSDVFRYKNKKPDITYINTQVLKEGDTFKVSRIFKHNKFIEFWYLVKRSELEKPEYPITGIPEKCPVCGASVSVIKDKVYCNNSTCPGILFNTIKRFFIIGAREELSLSELSIIKKLIFYNKVKCVSDLFHISLDELSSIWYYETRDDSDAKSFYDKIQNTKGNVSILNYLLSLPFFKENENYNIFLSSTFMSKINSVEEFINWLFDTSEELYNDDNVINSELLDSLESKISQEFFILLIDYFSIEDNVQEALYLDSIKLFK